MSSFSTSDILHTKVATEGHVFVADGRAVSGGAAFAYMPVMSKIMHVLKSGKVLFQDAFSISVHAPDDRVILVPFRERRGDVIVNISQDLTIGMPLQESALMLDEEEARKDLQDRIQLPASAIEEEITLATLDMLDARMRASAGAAPVPPSAA